MAASPPTRAWTSTSAAGACSRSARTCSPATPTTSCRWRRSRARPGISKALLYHYFPSKQAFFQATLEQAAGELAERVRPSDDLPPAEQLMHGLDAFLAWIEENETAYRKLMQSVASVPEARELVERVRHETADLILPGSIEGDEPPPELRTAVRGVAVVHGRRVPGVARAPRHGARPGSRPPAGHAAGGDHGVRAPGRAGAAGPGLLNAHYSLGRTASSGRREPRPRSARATSHGRWSTTSIPTRSRWCAPT